MIKHKTRIIIAGALGNLIESFDMTICGLLSVYLSKYFIEDSSKGLLLLFLTFFAGYLARPIGAVVMGLLSDKYGRKIILAISILVMGITTSLIGFIPPNSILGAISIYMLLTLRIIQSFSCGAEYLNSSAYLIENAEKHNRGYSGSWASFGAMAGMTLASIATFFVTYFIEQYNELEWLIWRVPFVLALLGSSIGLYIRTHIPESMDYIIYYSERPKPLLNNLFKTSFSYIKNNKLKSLYVFFLSCFGVTTTFQIYIFAPMQAHLYSNFTYNDIMLANIISLSLLLCLFPLIGKLSDKISREKIALTSALFIVILSSPFFYYSANSNWYQFVISQILITIPATAYYSTVPVMLAEIFPINLRCTVLSTLYSIAASLSAGLAPLISLLLVEKTHNHTSPAVLSLVLAACIFIIIIMNRFKYGFQYKYNEINT